MKAKPKTYWPRNHTETHGMEGEDLIFKIRVCIADILVEARIVVELKAVESLAKAHEAQLLNYLKASGKRVGLFVNFVHPKAEIRRFVL